MLLAVVVLIARDSRATFSEVAPPLCTSGYTTLDYGYAMYAHIVSAPGGMYGNNVDLTRKLAGNG